MIAVRLEGRLGNQLFQYAFIYATAKKLGVKFYLDQSLQPFLLDEYFEVDQSPYQFLQKQFFSIRGYKNLFSYYLKNAFYSTLKKIFGLYHINFSNTVTPSEELKKLRNGAFYTGFFQSEQYFEQHTSDIAQQFTIKPYYKQQYQHVREQLPGDKTMVVIHIRRGDYLSLNYNLPDSYYHEAIKNIKAAHPFYIFISDDPDHVKAEFAYLANKYVSFNSEIVDFQLLQNADVCILSNSSFSWWGAWLNSKNDKQVYAPEYWIGFTEKKEFPAGIFNNLNFTCLTV